MTSKHSPKSIQTTSEPITAGGSQTTLAELNDSLSEAREACNSLLALDRIPQDAEILRTLEICDALTKVILSYDLPTTNESGAVSSLLKLDTKIPAKKQPLHKLPATLLPIVDELSELSYNLVKSPPVFISPEALQIYTRIQTSLQRPQTLPEVFHLYANKDLPVENTSNPIKYKPQSPKKVGNAIPQATADLALQSAVATRQLTTAMDLIETSYSTAAFQRAKFVRKGLLPFTGLAVAPVAAYTIASQLAHMQSTMDTQLATNVAFTGMIAYIGFTATIGIVAITTANDQMERVTWTQGMPLRERWIREEERAAIDKVAQAWGFKETWRRGEEEGDDWEALREWVGQRGMILDAAELMEGME